MINSIFLQDIKFVNKLKLKGYSHKTIKNSIKIFKDYINYIFSKIELLINIIKNNMLIKETKKLTFLILNI